MSKKIQNQVLLITGSTGIAAATAELASCEGAKIFITSRTAEHGRALIEKIHATNAECDFFAADLTVPDAVATAVEHCRARFGRIDALFNVAGISGRKFGDGPVHECTEAGWDITMNTNAKTVFFMCRAVIAQMLRQPPGENGLRGSILNMASVLGHSPSPKFFETHAYAASKGAIIALSKAMAASYAPQKIRVNVIAPALVRTPMSARAQQNPDVLHFMKTKQPLVEDLIDADAVARAAAFLLSDDASAITGDVVNVDAGWCVSEGQHGMGE
ncbi:MAG: SDR family oxidoreductase [Verrucomicrobia bacterium]|nr:SDR family oxidoreductase [Verrucomicrobiota bacterium]